MSITHCYCQILNVYTFFYFMSISKLAAACNPPSKKVNQIPFLYNQEMKPRISKQVVGHDRRIYTTIHHNRLRNNLYFKFQFLKYPSTAIFFATELKHVVSRDHQWKHLEGTNMSDCIAEKNYWE